MRSLEDFWGREHWGYPFGAFGSRYTIVYQRHIGLDMRRTGEIPALFSGRVVRRTHTGTMAWVVVLDTGLPGNRRYHSYCHIAGDRLPDVGVWINRGERVGRVALGSRNKFDPDWGGTAWDGPHMHFVVGGDADSAYYMVPGHRELGAFTDPTVVISDALAAPAWGGGTPFVPGEPEEEDDMFDDKARQDLEALKKLVEVIANRLAAPTIPILVQTADKADGRVFLLMETGELRHIRPKEKETFVRRAQSLGYAPADFDRLFVHRIGGIGTLPNYKPKTA